jgi:hypothetical protein
MSSRRPSSTKKPRPPEPFTFFTDRDLGNAIADALGQAGAVVKRHDQVFQDPRTPGTVWLEYVGQQGWIALSHNTGIQRVIAERDAAMRANIALFFLAGKLTHPQLAANAVATLSRIIAFRRKHEPPFTARVYRPDVLADLGSKPGRVEMWMTKELWEQQLRHEASKRQR